MGEKLVNLFSKWNVFNSNNTASKILSIRQYYLLGQEIHKQASKVPDSPEIISILKELSTGNDLAPKDSEAASTVEVVPPENTKPSTEVTEKSLSHLSIKKDAQTNATRLNNHNVLFLSEFFEDELLKAIDCEPDDPSEKEEKEKQEIQDSLERDGEAFALHLLERKVNLLEFDKFSIEKIILTGISIYKVCNLGNIDVKIKMNRYEFKIRSNRFNNRNSMFYAIGYIKGLGKLAKIHTNKEGNFHYDFDEGKRVLNVIIAAE